MSYERINSLETRVTTVEHDVSEIKIGMVDIARDIKDNTAATIEVKNNTGELVKIAIGTRILFGVVTKVTAIAAGVAGAVYLYRFVAG